MDTQGPTEKKESSTEFAPGTSVIYALHGKCNVLGTELRSLGERSILFYKLEIKKNPSSRSQKAGSAIWVPVSSARDQGLRTPMSKGEAEAVLKILMSREYFFKWDETWQILQPKLEATIKKEGGVGLAKVASFLFVLKKKQVVPTSDVIKMEETIHRLLFRELSEALGLPARALEEKTIKGFRSKLIPDT